MFEQGLKGGVVAISVRGRVVYANSYGYAHEADSVPMRLEHVMRVASVSKLITAVAVMRLVEEGRLALSQRVFGPTGVLNDEVFLTYKDKRILDITIENLLNHSGGWMTRYGDQMFMSSSIAKQMGCDLPISIDDIIRFVESKNLHFAPGSSSYYSNFGYALLGEVVAKVARMPYEDYVRSAVFAPLGVYDARIGYSHQCDRLAHEVSYYEADSSGCVPDYCDDNVLVRRAYGGSDIHTLGAAGGWVLNAVDLLKLVLAIDGYPEIPDLLSQESISLMTDPKSSLDPLGWRKVIGEAWFRTGTLAATSAVLVRRPDNICFVVVFNSSNYLGPGLAVLTANKMNDAISKMREFPSLDLLESDERWKAYKTCGR